MKEQVIHIEGLSKSYRIGHRKDKTFRGNLSQALSSLFGSNTNYETFWALKDVSLSIEEGEVLGIIGRNGAGKTTLLKLLSRITYPSQGRFLIRGRVASLLEVGTGFHAELSGRENIFLNGTILGMSRSEVRSKFDEIVDFSGVESFLDTPVKRYSSGMFVRLAFSVAAHLEPEVLIVDEVLAVGDAAFQRKCLGKMGQVAQQGRTVLFVSHNMGAVGQLCTRAIWLEDGKMKADGATDKVIQQYLTSPANQGESYTQRSGNKKAVFSGLKLENAAGQPCADFRMGDDIQLGFQLSFQENINELDLVVGIRNAAGDRITHILNHDEGFGISGLSGQVKSIRIKFPEVLLSPGKYHISLGAEKYAEEFDIIENAIAFTMSHGPRVGRTTPYPGNVAIYLPGKWKYD